MAERHASWVYAVVPASAPSLPVITGVADEPVRLVTHGDITAVTGSVNAADVDEEAWRRRLNDLAWLEHAARSHHRVVARCFETAPAVPFRLATVYRNDQRVADMLAQRDRELAQALATVARRAEWGVQVFRPPPQDHDDPPAVDYNPARPGTSYLMRRRAQRSAVETRRRSAAEAAEEVHAVFQQLAVAAARTPPTNRPAGHPGGQEGRMVLNAAYLIDDDRRDDVAAAARELSERHPALQLRVTGPWPAYSFVEIGEGVPA